MKSQFILFCLFLGTNLLLTANAEQKDRLFYDGVRAEAAGDLDLAISKYHEASVFSHSTNLHGNLANLYFKKEQFGRSILHFRKALLLNPRNSELTENLRFTYEMANIEPKTKNLSDTYFSANFLSFWIITSTIIFWIGIFIFFYLFFFRPVKKIFVYFVISWLFVLTTALIGTKLSLKSNSTLCREVVVHFPTVDNNHTNTIPLRRFAGATSSANTNVYPGESLIIQIGSDKYNRSYKLPSGEIWYLAKSIDNKKKGWIREDEIGWIIDPT